MFPSSSYAFLLLLSATSPETMLCFAQLARSSSVFGYVVGYTAAEGFLRCH